LIRAERPDAFLHHFVHIPWPHSDAWRVIPRRWREQIYRGLLANDVIGFHLQAYVNNFVDSCRDLMDLEVDWPNRTVHHEGGQTRVRAYPLGVDSDRLRDVASSSAIANYERELLQRRREHLILRVDRADLSKNILRGFTAFDQFLEDHPEFHEKVTFIAHLQPSRQDVPEYQEYLERIEALVAVVNHRHGTTDWMPIDLRVYDNFYEAVARYKHYDLLMVNALFDGMNLVAKEAPAVNTRDGVLMLSENTGAHAELGEHALSVNPFDIDEQAGAIHRALTMSESERAERADGLRAVIERTDPGTWIDQQLDDIERARGSRVPAD
ncbi:MAG: alpha,alpha-trehalose-phosphate synthase (UDP-forming), partial [Solirubrobacterales bacterium]